MEICLHFFLFCFIDLKFLMCDPQLCFLAHSNSICILFQVIIVRCLPMARLVLENPTPWWDMGPTSKYIKSYSYAV